MSGIFNVIVGLIMLVGGLSGKLDFPGTSSSGILAAVGAVVTGLGVYQLVKNRRGR